MTELNSLLSIQGVQKAFDGIFALQGVSFQVQPGECLALVGENGAGKSTLMKILSGVWPHGSYDGDLFFAGEKLTLKTPLEGRRTGISIIHQELCLFPQLTAAENLFLTEAFPYDGNPSQALFSPVRWGTLFERAQNLFAELGFEVDAEALVEDLSVAQRQLVEIARACHHEARLLILDEPTSALSAQEVRQLFEVIRRMKAKNVAFIYISHKLDEVFELADRIVVLRDGRSVAELDPKAVSSADVIRHMVGRPLKQTARHSFARETEPVLEVSDLSHVSPSGKKMLEGVYFKVRPGEIYGVAGLMGSGRSELLRSILGVLPGERTGSIQMEGKSAQWQDLGKAMEEGIAFVPEDRKKDGLFLDLAIKFNISISNLNRVSKRWLNLNDEDALVEEYARQMAVKCNRLEDKVRVLSGGNQQKVLLAKMVARRPKILFLDEPTRGIDVGAKEEIYEIVRRLASEGIAVVMVSSELPEVLALCDRVLVLREGKAMGELVNRDLTQEQIMAFAAGEAKHGIH